MTNPIARAEIAEQRGRIAIARTSDARDFGPDCWELFHLTPYEVAALKKIRRRLGVVINSRTCFGSPGDPKTTVLLGPGASKLLSLWISEPGVRDLSLIEFLTQCAEAAP